MLEVRGQAMDFEVGAADDNSAPIDYISNEEYDKKEGTVRDYLRKNKLGKFSEDYQAKKLQEEKEQLELYESLKGRVSSRMYRKFHSVHAFSSPNRMFMPCLIKKATLV